MGSQPYRFTRSENLTAFRFTSVGPAGHIRKRIELQDLDIIIMDEPVYNLAFGDVGEDGKIDDKANSNNGDIVRIMSTVVAAIRAFTKRYPDRLIFFTGSDGQRTAFYQTILRRKLQTLTTDFDIFGLAVSKNGRQEILAFDPQKEFGAFLVLRKLKGEAAP